MKRMNQIALLLIIFSLGLIFNNTESLAKSVNVELPNYNITFNGELINNEKSTYPVIVYKGITYFPLTWDYCAALGIEATWDNNIGLSVNKQILSDYVAIKQDLNGQNFKTQKLVAYYPEFIIKINDQKIDNENEEYPLLVYKGITYFPMTWKYAVNYFNLKTDWDNQTGFKIDTKEYISYSSKMQVTSRISEGEKLTTREIVQKIQPATVLVETNRGLGSGFFISQEGNVVTNAHVVRGSQWINVITTNGVKYSAALKSIDNTLDIALLVITRKVNVPFISKFAPINVLSPGDEVVVFGNPLGLTGTVTTGIINAIREDTTSEAWLNKINIIQYDAMTAPGSSGGAAVNLYGECIGIHFAGLDNPYYKFNFAIPTQYYLYLVNSYSSYSVKDDIYSYFTENWQWTEELNEITCIKLNGTYSDYYTIQNIIIPRLNLLIDTVKEYSAKYDETELIKNKFLKLLKKEISYYSIWSSAVSEIYWTVDYKRVLTITLNEINNSFTDYYALLDQKVNSF